MDLQDEVIKSVFFRFLTVFISGISLIYFTRKLGAGVIGLYFLILAISNIIKQPFSGLSNTLRKKISEGDVNSDEFITYGLMIYFVYNVLVFLVIFLVFLVQENYVFSVPFIEDITGFHLLLVVGIVMSQGLFAIINSSYSGLGFPGNSVLLDTLRTLTSFIFQVVVIYFYDVEEVGLLVSLIVSSLLFSFVSWNLAGFSLTRSVFNIGKVKEVLDFTYNTSLFSIFSRVYKELDILLSGIFVGHTYSGYYETSHKITVIPVFFSNSVSEPLSIRTSNKQSKGDESFRGDVRMMISYFGLIAIPLFFGSLIVGNEVLLTMYSQPEFNSLGYVLVLIAFYKIGFSYRSGLVHIIDSINKPKINKNMVIVLTFIKGLFSVFGGIYMGFVGILLASILSESIGVISYGYILHNMGLSPYYRKILIQFLSGGIMLGYLFVLEDMLNLYDLVDLLFSVVSGGLLFFVLMIFIDKYFRKIVLDYFEDNFNL